MPNVYARFSLNMLCPAEQYNLNNHLFMVFILTLYFADGTQVPNKIKFYETIKLQRQTLNGS